MGTWVRGWPERTTSDALKDLELSLETITPSTVSSSKKGSRKELRAGVGSTAAGVGVRGSFRSSTLLPTTMPEPSISPASKRFAPSTPSISQICCRPVPAVWL